MLLLICCGQRSLTHIDRIKTLVTETNDRVPCEGLGRAGYEPCLTEQLLSTAPFPGGAGAR